MKGDRDDKSAKKSATRNCLHSAVVVNDHMYNIISLSLFFHVSIYDPFWVKNDIWTGIHIMIIHYNCTIGSFLLHSFLLIYHPFISYVRMRISADRAPAE